MMKLLLQALWETNGLDTSNAMAYLCWAACLHTNMMAFLHCFWDSILSCSASLYETNKRQ